MKEQKLLPETTQTFTGQQYIDWVYKMADSIKDFKKPVVEPKKNVPDEKVRELLDAINLLYHYAILEYDDIEMVENRLQKYYNYYDFGTGKVRV